MSVADLATELKDKVAEGDFDSSIKFDCGDDGILVIDNQSVGTDDQDAVDIVAFGHGALRLWVTNWRFDATPLRDQAAYKDKHESRKRSRGASARTPLSFSAPQHRMCATGDL